MANWCIELQTEVARRDPTWLSEIHQRYEKHVEVLLRSSDLTLVGDIEPQLLQTFRNIYGGQSYFCRYKICASATGFNSRETRDQHEAAHVWKYRCEVLNCFRGDRGFKEQRDLKLHCQMYHPPPEVPKLALDPPSSIPASLSRTLEGPTLVFPPDVKLSFSVELLHQFSADSECTSVAISPNEHYYAVGAKNVIHVCSLGSGEEVMRFEIGAPETYRWVRDVCFTPDSKLLIAAVGGEIMVCC